jgi:hypothetical protein
LVEAQITTTFLAVSLVCLRAGFFHPPEFYGPCGHARHMVCRACEPWQGSQHAMLDLQRCVDPSNWNVWAWKTDDPANIVLQGPNWHPPQPFYMRESAQFILSSPLHERIVKVFLSFVVVKIVRYIEGVVRGRKRDLGIFTQDVLSNPGWRNSYVYHSTVSQSTIYLYRNTPCPSLGDNQGSWIRHLRQGFLERCSSKTNADSCTAHPRTAEPKCQRLGAIRGACA